MDEVLITKRLHISGLTPNLTPSDLSTRLSTFGTVKALEGFGLPDGLGEPRKFGYVTIESTAPKLARCLNLLSGSTWKGAKLRIGEAKPDFEERLSRERESAEEPPKKKRRRAHGVHAEDMSLVTPENVKERPGWKVTTMGRIIKPVRIRPDHPLGEPLEVKKVKKKSKDDGKGDDKGEEKKKKKKREKQPDARARRKTIDPTRYGSVHLKGMFLEVHDTGENPTVDLDFGRSDKVDEESEESDTSEEEEVDPDSKQVVEPPIPSETKASPAPASTVPAIPATPTSIVETVTLPITVPTVPASVSDDDTDITMEKTKTLDLLNSLFGGKEWGGQESVGSDIDEEELTKGMQIQVDAGEDNDIEEVPMDVDVAVNAVETEEDESEEEEPVEAVPEKQQEPPTVKQQQATKLKDLFAPRDDEAGFSLLGHLDLDLELDDEIIFEKAPEIQDAPPSHLATAATSSSTNVYASTTSAPHNLTLDPRQPLFFPLASSFPTSTTSWMSTKARSRDLFDVARENGWNWRDENVGFWRTGTEEDIRKRWEGEKLELTREWKRRCREAGKIRRRRGAGVDAE